MEVSKKIFKNRIFYSILILSVVISISITFYKIVIKKDYQIIAEASCDPQIEKCFVYICDPSNDEKCSQNETERVSYYKLINKNAADIAICEATNEKKGCNEELSCINDEQSCTYVYCDPNNLKVGEICSK